MISKCHLNKCYRAILQFWVVVNVAGFGNCVAIYISPLPPPLLLLPPPAATPLAGRRKRRRARREEAGAASGVNLNGMGRPRLLRTIHLLRYSVRDLKYMAFHKIIKAIYSLLIKKYSYNITNSNQLSD